VTPNLNQSGCNGGFSWNKKFHVFGPAVLPEKNAPREPLCALVELEIAVNNHKSFPSARKKLQDG